MKVLWCALFLFISTFTYGKIVFSQSDESQYEKKNLITDINEIMGLNNNAHYVIDSSKVLLWTNSAKVLEKSIDGKKQYVKTTLPSFTPVTSDNEEHLRAIITKQCECDIKGEKIAGIMIASPYVAAKMYFRKGWGNYTGDEVDGYVPPAVIIYHEFTHVKDFLSSPDHFFDAAVSRDKRYMNLAEKSAVEAQNDFVLLLGHKRKIFASRRMSYGKNELYEVNGPFDF